MSKRFTDTALWEKEWFAGLSPVEKCAWFYIKDRCDPVGVWDPSFNIANFYLGEKLDWDAFRVKCNGNINVLANGKWWLVDFCRYQYGELDENSKAPPVISYIKLLKKHGLWELYSKGIDTLAIPLPKGSDTPKDKDKDKDKDKVKDKDSSLPVVKDKDSNTELFNKIKESFQAVSGDFTNYAREGAAIKKIIAYVKGDEEQARAMLETFLKLTRGSDRFWSGQPFRPSALAASGIWDRVKLEYDKQHKAAEPWWDALEAERVAQ